MTVRPHPAARLADRLLEAGKINKEYYEAALAYMAGVGGRVEEALLEVNALAETELLKFLASYHKTRFVTTERLAKADIDRITLDKLPRKFVEQAQLVPVLYDPQTATLSVITADPDNLEALRDAQILSSAREIKAFIARPAAVRASIAKMYGGNADAFTFLNKGDHQPFADLNLRGGYERNTLPIENPTNPFIAEEGTAKRNVVPAEGGKDSSSEGTPSAPGQDAYLETLHVLVSLIENTRTGLRGHSSHVARLCRMIGERIRLAPADTQAIVAGAHLHDLGKMGEFHVTAWNIANQEAHRALAEKTYQAPRGLMAGCNLTATTLGAIETMYERYDGKGGVPGLISGKDIPVGGRILALADTYADFTQNPHNPSDKILRPLEACNLLNQYRGAIFDPNLIDLLKLCITGEDLKGRLLGERHSVLLVDPDPEETTVLELRMLQQGIVVRIAHTADHALSILQSEDVEVVISEIDLSPRDGFSLLKEVRNQPWGQDLPWLLLTRRQGSLEAQRAFELGVTDFLNKPANVDVLIAKLKQLFEQRAVKALPRGVSGNLSEMSLPDIVQVLWHGRKSGTLKIQNGTERGEIHFVEGQIYQAFWAKLRGEEAFYAMIHLKNGDFALVPNARAPSKMIQQNPEILLLEALRRLDESLVSNR